MICPKCHGNGYWIEQLRALRQVRQCKTCSSQGEIKETSDAKTNKDLTGVLDYGDLSAGDKVTPALDTVARMTL